MSEDTELEKFFSELDTSLDDIRKHGWKIKSLMPGAIYFERGPDRQLLPRWVTELLWSQRRQGEHSARNQLRAALGMPPLPFKKSTHEARR